MIIAPARAEITAEDHAWALDAADPLAAFRDRFYLAPDTIYLDGNSLGLLSRDAEAEVLRVLDQWKRLGDRRRASIVSTVSGTKADGVTGSAGSVVDVPALPLVPLHYSGFQMGCPIPIGRHAPLSRHLRAEAASVGEQAGAPERGWGRGLLRRQATSMNTALTVAGRCARLVAMRRPSRPLAGYEGAVIFHVPAAMPMQIGFPALVLAPPEAGERQVSSAVELLRVDQGITVA